MQKESTLLSGMYQQVDRTEAVEIQQELKNEIELTPVERPIDIVAGADISFERGSDRVYAGVVLLHFSDLTPLARSLVVTEVDFPYIPGLLAFRELPALLEAWELLNEKPDITVLDGHGLAHPRRMGLATHFGIETGIPAIGCAKKLLVGECGEPGRQKGDYEPIMDEEGKTGYVYRSRTDVKPIYLSPGHKVTFEDTLDVVSGCLTKFRLPETTRAAHKMVNRLREGEIEPGYKEYEADEADG